VDGPLALRDQPLTLNSILTSPVFRDGNCAKQSGQPCARRPTGSWPGLSWPPEPCTTLVPERVARLGPTSDLRSFRRKQESSPGYPLSRGRTAVGRRVQKRCQSAATNGDQDWRDDRWGVVRSLINRRISGLWSSLISASSARLFCCRWGVCGPEVPRQKRHALIGSAESR
jgi:hypothetical protein